MELKYSFDELLCQSLLLFRQYKMYGDEPECEENASRFLSEALQVATESKDDICMAKWGCVVECLAQRYYINNATDALLENIDASLLAFWKKAERTDITAFSCYLWIGYYFLLRFRNAQSHFHTRSRRVLDDVVSFLVEIFRKFKKQTVSGEVLSLFSIDVWGDTVYWVELVHDTRVCEKQSANLLGQLYNLKEIGLQPGRIGQNALLQQILEFYCF